MAVRNVREEFAPVWQAFRIERAQVRKRLLDEAQRFWVVFPRLRRRVMPICYFSDKTNWFETEPVQGLPWEDRLGLQLRWRRSGVIPIETSPGVRKLRAIWEYDWPRDSPPSVGDLSAAKITDPGDQENYRYFWKVLHDWYDHYLYLGKWFEKIVDLGAEASARLAKVVESHGELAEIHKSADVYWGPPVDKKGGRA